MCASTMFIVFRANFDKTTSPPIGVYSRKPIMVLPRSAGSSPISSLEKGSVHEDDLDRHVEDVLARESKFRRTMSGVWAFMKTRKSKF